MRRRTLIGGLSALALGVAIAVAGPAIAQQYYGGGYGPGWMGPGMMGGGYGSEWMGPGMMYGSGYGPGGMGPGMMYGYRHGYGGDADDWQAPQRADLNLSVDQVTSHMQRWLRARGNSHLRLGAVTEKDANTITADIVTVDKDGLVQRYDINRHTGFTQPEG